LKERKAHRWRQAHVSFANVGHPAVDSGTGLLTTEVEVKYG
jgi:hypothetical protein